MKNLCLGFSLYLFPFEVATGIARHMRRQEKRRRQERRRCQERRRRQKRSASPRKVTEENAQYMKRVQGKTALKKSSMAQRSQIYMYAREEREQGE